ncbi:MAG: FG-GAP repeat protein, partial [Acidobacteriota bacterium]
MHHSGKAHVLSTVLAFIVALAALGANAGRARVTASSDSKQSSTGQHSYPIAERDSGLTLSGQPAVDYLKKQGLFDRIKASVEAGRYGISWQSGTGTHQANNPTQNFQASFTCSGVEITPNQQNTQRRWQIGMELRGVGYGDDVSEITSGPVRASGNRIELQKSNIQNRGSKIVEWYVNKSEGIEQGFTLSERPRLKFGDQPLRVSLALTGGLKASVVDGGQAVTLSMPDGKQMLRYDHLAANDVLGRSLAARMELRAGEISLLVDDSAAIYPVTIDPLFTEVRKLTASDRATGDNFGWSVGISGDTVVVGAILESSKGAAYVFERNKGGADNWGEVKKLTASDGATSDFFGSSVGISVDTVVVGANRDDTFKGSAYIFGRNKGGADNWGEVRKLTASDGAANDEFGFAVGISVDTVVVGAYRDDTFKGSAYIFERNTGGADLWGEVRKLTASDGAGGDFFGISIGISVDTVVVGASGDDAAKGSAYIFERNRGGADLWG